MILQYKNIPVFYEDVGKGKAVVLLHGFLENSSMWKDIIPLIIKKNRVITIDLLGHGQTECLGYMHTMSDMADAVLAVLKHLRLRRYIVIGHSMGGYVALSLAEKEPQAIRGLCLMNSTYHGDDDERKALRKKANQMVQANFESMVRISFTNLFSEESRINHKKELQAALVVALKTPLQGYMAAMEGMRVRDDKTKLFKSLSAKKLIIIGKKDPVVDRERILKDTECTDIICEELSYGHMSYIENKSELSYIIMHFVE